MTKICSKICSKCKLELDKSEFSKNKNKKDGLNNYCKLCIKKYHKNNKNKVLKYKYKYRDNNKDKIAKKRLVYLKKRRLKDIIFKLRQDISTKINKALKNNNSSKNGKSILQYIPYTINELKQHLESQFESWMNWENHGKISNNKRTWNIDHIIPQSLLPYTSMEDENFRKCWALENLQPLESFENIKKSNKIEPK